MMRIILSCSQPFKQISFWFFLTTALLSFWMHPPAAKVSRKNFIPHHETNSSCGTYIKWKGWFSPAPFSPLWWGQFPSPKHLSHILIFFFPLCHLTCATSLSCSPCFLMFQCVNHSSCSLLTTPKGQSHSRSEHRRQYFFDSPERRFRHKHTFPQPTSTPSTSYPKPFYPLILISSTFNH